MIAVVDYGVANLGSMLNMLNKVGVNAVPVASPEGIDRAERIILPGVGAFDHGMAALTATGLVEPLRRRVLSDGVPILGVCLGMQLLGTGSEEGELPGLGLVDGECLRFRFEGPGSPKVPHMGWNTVSATRASPLLDDRDVDARYYFVHSYHMVCADSADVLGTTHYGVDFTSMIQRANVYGAQFHPEKSHRFGMALLRNFASI